ncbi:hypothetical protein [Litorivita sp. NS0012-18]|uniref:hypothetical protein n=1 Tax=Litorivita sp. NS0012-18 TaxID=3127655 RepID=UPI0031034D39
MSDLRRQYDPKNWPGKTISDEDATLIEIAVRAAIADSRIGIFQRDLIAACASVSWQHDHPMTLWTVALYTNVFPMCEMPREVRRYDGLLHFAGPSIALDHSTLDSFWNDRDLVCLALKRTNTSDFPVEPQGQRSGLRPYQGW